MKTIFNNLKKFFYNLIKQLTIIKIVNFIKNNKYIILIIFLSYIVRGFILLYTSTIWDFDTNNLYAFLNTLTLLEEVALANILLYILIIMIFFDILIVLFGNEIIQYFYLEKKFPYLNKFFKLRAQLQKYYLMWSMFLLFIACVVGLGMNLFIFI